VRLAITLQGDVSTGCHPSGSLNAGGWIGQVHPGRAGLMGVLNDDNEL